MMGYQSFSDVKGDSDSFGKLQAIKLPDMKGKTFLDVGCNAGFFCGAALESGAEKVVGIDVDPAAIELARRNFPGASFIPVGWDTLPEGDFDVVLSLSALHYADDQADLIERLMGKVKSSGLLVLEVGVAPGQGEEWVETRRAIDTRFFPTMPMMQKVLGKYTYRLMGPSVRQAGDPNARFVFHVWHRKPVVLACLGDSGVGKSDLARLMAAESQRRIRILHLDDHLVDFASGHGLLGAGDSSDAGISLVDLGPLYLEICRKDLVDDLAAYVASSIQGAPLALIEGGMPHGYRTHFLNRVGQILDVDIWNLAPVRVRSIEAPDARAAQSRDWVPAHQLQAENKEILGYVDEFRLTGNGMVIVGWGYDRAHREPIEGVRVEHDDLSLDLMQINRRRRPDVSEQLRSELDMLGFVVEIPLATDLLEKLRNSSQVRPPSISLWASGMLSPRMRPKVAIVDP
ncbi:trans-aconitate 2-methyltransferase [Curvibacter sp. PAE-UM]|uniref:class I SAM-dependent methyltransferase n=1 Tax=Curvibacter sp. PAE-UM TaxID=1714344 RepID=UPI0007098FBB|nr:class I SAM-dependent methyltransferase [Curvibacter sp. PAE-UM]KRI00007.1 hypothetical protein AO057_15720 [Curvibacter sp. PAE-UM]